MEKCFACDKRLKKIRLSAYTSDGQCVFVGPDCYEKIQKGFKDGYQPPTGGPRLYTPIVYRWISRTGADR